MVNAVLSWVHAPVLNPSGPRLSQVAVENIVVSL